MSNPWLSKRPDKSVAAALKKALLDGEIYRSEVIDIAAAALDGGKVDDVEYRDIMRFVRKQPGLNGHLRATLLKWLAAQYPLEPIGVYPHGNILGLEGTGLKGNHECAALIQHSQSAGMAASWRQGIQVKGNTHIKPGTPVATFEDGFYPNRATDNHVAYYISQDKVKGVRVMDQWAGQEKVESRWMAWLGKLPNQLYKDPGNNGDALFVIMRKKPKSGG